MTYSLTWLADIPRRAGLKVAEQPGWQTRGHGDVGKILGVICHHTAGGQGGNAPSLGVVTHGRAAGPGTTALAGPLSQYVLGRDGTVYVIGAGRSYHAGAGRWQGVTDGNTHMIGIEAENTGYTTGPRADPWPEVQMDAYVRLVAGILDHVGAPTIMACAHREWTPRKIDPAGIDMNAFRARVAGVRNGAPVRPPIPAKDAVGRPTLRRGAKGDDVKALQGMLGLPADGAFGPATEAALRAWQRAQGLVADGIAGPGTWGQIDHVRAAA